MRNLRVYLSLYQEIHSHLLCGCDFANERLFLCLLNLTFRTHTSQNYTKLPKITCDVATLRNIIFEFGISFLIGRKSTVNSRDQRCHVI